MLRRWWWLALALVVGTSAYLAMPRRSGEPAPALEIADELAPVDDARLEAVEPVAHREEAAPTEGFGERGAQASSQVPREVEIGGDLVRVSGRVVIPVGTPSDESVTVLARDAPYASGALRTALARPDGSFEIEFSRAAGQAMIGLEARYLHLEAGTAVRAREVPDEVVLTPYLGGRIRGRIELAPAGAGHREAARRATLRAKGAGVPRRGRITEELEFEVGGLPSAVYELEFAPVGLAGRAIRGLRVDVGQTVEVEILTTLGARVAGRVVDESGIPFKGLLVAASNPQAEDALDRSGRTDETGRFSITGVAPGSVELSVTGPFAESATRTIDGLAEGGEMTDVEIVTKRRSALSGVVRWPDGTPAAGARVECLENRSGTRCDAEGRFDIRENGGELVSIVASTKAHDGSTWIATDWDVEAGTLDRVIVLRESHGMTVRVIDASGDPVRGAAVELRRVIWDDHDRATARRFDSESTGADGRARIDGIYEGDWDVVVRARGLARSGRSFRVPADSLELEFRLPPEARIEGRVVDESGEPVPGALIALDFTGVEPVPSSRSLRMPRGRADEAGEFRLEGIEAGVYALHARRPNTMLWRSDSMPLHVGVGESLTGLTLEIKRSAFSKH